MKMEADGSEGSRRRTSTRTSSQVVHPLGVCYVSDCELSVV